MGRTQEALAGFGAAAASGLMLFALRTNQQLGDSLVYLSSIQTGDQFFHPHHMLYNPSVWLVHLATTHLGAPTPELFAAQIHNIAWSMVAVLAMFILVRRVTGEFWMGMLSAVALAMTNGVLELSTQTTVYSPAAAVPLVLAAYLTGTRFRALKPASILTAGLLLALSILYHQANVLLCIPVAWYLVAMRGRRGAGRAAAVIACAGVATLAVYWIGAVAASGGSSITIREFVYFCTSYASEICWGQECVPTPIDWGGASNLSLAGMEALLASVLENYVALPGRIQPLASRLLGAGLLLLIGYHAWQGLRASSQRAPQIFLLLSGLIYLGFSFWWLPTYTHPLYIGSLPLLALVFLTLAELRSRVSGVKWASAGLAIGVWLLIGAVGALNLYLRVVPRHLERADSFYEAADLVEAANGSADYHTSYRVWNHLRYYFDKHEDAKLGKYPLILFYNRMDLAEVYAAPNKTRVVDANLVRPDYVVAGYSERGSSAYTAPQEWLSYVHWLFGTVVDEDDVVTERRAVRAVSVHDGRLYFVIDQATESEEGLRGLFTHLDDLIAQRSVSNERPFARWTSETNYRSGETERAGGPL